MSGPKLQSLFTAAVEWLHGLLTSEHERRPAEIVSIVLPILPAAYDALTKGLRETWPKVEFRFPAIATLQSDLSARLRYKPLRGPVEPLGVALEPVVEAAVRDFMSSDLDVHKSSTEMNYADDTTYGNVRGGRNPSDWEFRRRIVFERDSGRCNRCGYALSLNGCHIHHVVRRAQGGNHLLMNLVVLCRDCHSLLEGHEKLYGGPFYYRSFAGTLHTGRCHHAIGAIKAKEPLPELLQKGFQLCLICTPRVDAIPLNGVRLQIRWFVRMALKEIADEVRLDSTLSTLAARR